MGHHGSSGGFSVGAGNADGILIGLHDLTPCLRTLKHRNAAGAGSRDLRIVIVRRGGADDAVGTCNVLGTVTDGHDNALTDQFIRGNRGVHIGTCHQHTHTLEHQSQRTHGNAADAHQVYMLARNQVFLDVLVLFNHVFQISR